MHASRTPPPGYVVVGTTVLRGRLVVWLNLLSLPLFAVSGALLLTLARALRPDRMGGGMRFASMGDLAWFAVGFGAGAILTPLVVVLAHEAIHGLGFWLSTRARPVFGVRIWYVYASAPGWYLPRHHYLALGLAPLVVLTVVGLVLSLLLPPPLALLAAFGTAVNAAASIGDAYLCAHVAGLPRTAVVADERDRCTYYAPA